MRIDINNILFGKVNNTEKKDVKKEISKVEISEVETEDVKVNIDHDLISKMMFIEEAMKKPEEDNSERIQLLKSKIENNEYHVNPMELIDNLREGV